MKKKRLICVIHKGDMRREGLEGIILTVTKSKTLPDGQKVESDFKVTICAMCLINLRSQIMRLEQTGELQQILASSNVQFRPQKKIITPNNCGRVAAGPIIVPKSFDPKKTS